MAFASQGGERAHNREGPATAPAGSTDALGAIVDPNECEAGVGLEVVAQMHEIAAQLFISRPRANATLVHGTGAPMSMPFSHQSDDIDLDRTMEQVAGAAVIEDRDIIVREGIQRRHTVVLLLDLSGSMLGERVRTTAATVAALARELVDDRLAVLAFWSDAIWIKHLNQPTRPFALLDDILKIPAQGLTNIAFPLQLARQELLAGHARPGMTILLSDCIHNAGPDPRTFAARLDGLHVLVDASGQHDAELGGQLAQLGRGRIRLVRSHREVARSIGAFFAR